MLLYEDEKVASRALRFRYLLQDLHNLCFVGRTWRCGRNVWRVVDCLEVDGIIVASTVPAKLRCKLLQYVSNSCTFRIMPGQVQIPQVCNLLGL